jgi:hypothetical protein
MAVPDLARAGRFPRKCEELTLLLWEWECNCFSGTASAVAAVAMAPVSWPRFSHISVQRWVHEVSKGLVVPLVDHIPDVTVQFLEEKELCDIIQQVQPQGIELVHQVGGLIGPQAVVLQPAGRTLEGAEAIGVQQDVLQLRLRVSSGGQIVPEWSGDVD